MPSHGYHQLGDAAALQDAKSSLAPMLVNSGSLASVAAEQLRRNERYIEIDAERHDGWVVARITLAKPGYQIPFTVFCVFDKTARGAASTSTLPRDALE